MQRCLLLGSVDGERGLQAGPQKAACGVQGTWRIYPHPLVLRSVGNILVSVTHICAMICRFWHPDRYPRMLPSPGRSLKRCTPGAIFDQEPPSHHLFDTSIARLPARRQSIFHFHRSHGFDSRIPRTAVPHPAGHPGCWGSNKPSPWHRQTDCTLVRRADG
jgi:hypothetical protein